MTDQSTDRHPTDEPDGATAHQASLRPPGASVTSAAGDDPELAPAPDAPAGDEPFDDTVDARTGYDPEAVSGDTEVYRPDR
ncbi:hypothetical protein AB0J80_21430 [Actinoplanes sp. NPDC049548]|uniref:hypothetical protein n=1 Tax=Actinoplanes sp. NPDC049548 TaxID=3155152 RepID=UPI00343A8F9A